MAVITTDQARAVFVDKDGTLIHDVPYDVDPERISCSRVSAQAFARCRIPVT